MGFDNSLPIFWSLDFNVGVMCSVLGQRQGETVRVLAELALPNSNTVGACEAFLARTEPWIPWNPRDPLRVEIFGDATAERRSTAGCPPDWPNDRVVFPQRHPPF